MTNTLYPQILEVDLDEDLYLQIDVRLSDDEFRIVTVHLPTTTLSVNILTKAAYDALIR